MGKLIYISVDANSLVAWHIGVMRDACSRVPDSRLMVGLLSDEALSHLGGSSPILSFHQRKRLLDCLGGVDCVVKQDTLGYRDNFLTYRPDFVVWAWPSSPVYAEVRSELICLMREHFPDFSCDDGIPVDLHCTKKKKNRSAMYS